MRVFISGSKILNYYIKDGGLPKAVLSEIDNIMAEGTEIIIGDCEGADTLVQKYLHDRSYGHVTVYVSDAKYRTRNNIGDWEEKHFRVHKGNGYGIHIEKDLHMAEDADRGLAIWDEESKGTFINMVCLAAQGKTCSVYLLNEQKWTEICSLDELKLFLEPRDGWNDEDIEKVLVKCGFSEEMRNHLVTEHLISGLDLIDIVCQAPISLEKKYQTLEYLARDKNILKNEVMESAIQKRDYGETWKWFKNMIRAIVTDENEISVWSNLGMAWREIYDAGLFTDGQYDYGYMDKVLYLFEEWYDTDSFVEKSSGAGMFRSLSKVGQYIAREEAENDTGEGWYRVEAWEPLDEDWKEIRYDYYIFDNKNCWFEKLYPEKKAGLRLYGKRGQSRRTGIKILKRLHHFLQRRGRNKCGEYSGL